MKLYLQLAWRNLWRNKRRSLISIASVFSAVVFALGFNSMQLGQNELLVDTAVGLYTGYLQIMGKDFWQKRSLDQSVLLDSNRIAAIAQIPEVTKVTPRFESFALISHGSATKISPVVGIDPAREDAITAVRKRLVAGAYLEADSRGALIAEGLARSLSVGVGDSIVVYGQGYQGVTAAAVLPVTGVVKYPIPDLNNAMVFLALKNAQWLYAAPERLTGLVVMIDDPDALERVEHDLRLLADAQHDVMTWKKMMPEVVQSVDANNAGTVLMLLVLYIVIAFGIFGTVMMMTVERMREFGILVAVGLKRWSLIGITALESLLVSLVGAAAGLVVAYPILYYLHAYPILLSGVYADAMLAYGVEPILPFSIDPMNFVIQGFVVTAVGLVSAVYPMVVIRRFAPVKAIRGK